MSSHGPAEQRFRGLSNQGATCYMNSLLQSLFMTPELRKQLYEWKHNYSVHGEKENCIPYQLQALFAKLQLAKRPFVDTLGLTKSFGWDLKEGFQQHDVQEFCRVLFEAIEDSVRFTDCEGLISSLYEGYLTDYVKCSECGRESNKTDKFLDLSLTVRNDFEKIKNESLEKALLNFIKPEQLTGGNQYFCGICEKKVDALKGLKIQKFPYILVTQIKRFDLNYETFQRIKLNDRVSFPLILNCNNFLNDFKELEIKGKEDLQEEKPFSAPILKFDSPAKTDLKKQTSTGYELLTEDKDKRPVQPDPIIKSRVLLEQLEKRKIQQEQLINLYKQEGEFVYELFSIMIHSGSAFGGHYFAYIKSFEDSKWYNFNDAIVKEIDEKEIVKVYGGEGNTANAYLLMYRKICAENLVTVTDAEIPLYVLQETLLAENETKTESFKDEKAKIIHFKVNHNKKEVTFETRRDKSIKEFKLEVMNVFEIKEKPENVRIRSFNSVYEVLQDVFDDDKKISACQVWDYKVFGLEIKPEKEVWKPYNPNLITLKVYSWNDSITSKSQPDPVLLQIDKTSTGHSLLSALSTQFSIPFDSLLVLKKVYSSISVTTEILSDKNLSLSLVNLRVYENSQLYIEPKTVNSAKWPNFIEIEARRYIIRFNHPDGPYKSQEQPDFCYSVVIDQKDTLAALKTLISTQIHIPESQFLLRRGNVQGQEIKDLSLKLVQANMMNNSIVVVQKGTPTKLDEYRVQFSLATRPKDTSNKALCHSFIELFEFPVDCNLQVLTLKQALCIQIQNMFPSFELNPNKLRLRERNSERLTRCLRNSDLLKNYNFHEKKQIALQELQSAEEEILPHMMLVACKRWNPSTWEISEPSEFIIKRSSTMAELGKVFADCYGIQVFYI